MILAGFANIKRVNTTLHNKKVSHVSVAIGRNKLNQRTHFFVIHEADTGFAQKTIDSYEIANFLKPVSDSETKDWLVQNLDPESFDMWVKRVSNN